MRETIAKRWRPQQIGRGSLLDFALCEALGRLPMGSCDWSSRVRYTTPRLAGRTSCSSANASTARQTCTFQRAGLGIFIALDSALVMFMRPPLLAAIFCREVVPFSTRYLSLGAWGRNLVCRRPGLAYSRHARAGLSKPGAKEGDPAVQGQAMTPFYDPTVSISN